MLSDHAMILPAPLQRTLERSLPWLAERMVVLKALSFGTIGVVNSIVDAGIFFLALWLLTSSLVAANVLAWLVAVSGSYVMNSYVTFAAESGRTLRLADYGRFVASGIVGVIASTTTLVVAAMVMPVWAAKALAILVSFLVNFSLSHFVVFRPAAVGQISEARIRRSVRLPAERRFQLGVERVVAREHVAEFADRHRRGTVLAQEVRQAVDLLRRAMQRQHAGRGRPAERRHDAEALPRLRRAARRRIRKSACAPRGKLARDPAPRCGRE